MDKGISRKQFLKGTLALAGAGTAMTALARCGKSDSGPADAGVCANGAINGAISSNHGHTLMVPAADIQAAAQKTYAIQGTAPHNHTVTVTPAQFAQLAQNQTFTVTSSTDGATPHSHAVTVMCAP